MPLRRLGVPADDVVAVANETGHDLVALAWSQDLTPEERDIQVALVELRDIPAPDSMKRAMTRQAEAEREKREKIIAAQGEALAAGDVGHALQAATEFPVLAAEPAPTNGEVVKT